MQVYTNSSLRAYEVCVVIQLLRAQSSEQQSRRPPQSLRDSSPSSKALGALLSAGNKTCPQSVSCWGCRQGWRRAVATGCDKLLLKWHVVPKGVFARSATYHLPHITYHSPLTTYHLSLTTPSFAWLIPINDIPRLGIIFDCGALYCGNNNNIAVGIGSNHITWLAVVCN